MLRTLLRAAAALAFLAAPAHAQLVVRDFLTAGDRLLVDDQATGLTWLSPVYTRNTVYNSPVVQSVIGAYGFRYATADETRSMIAANFGNPSMDGVGDAAGYAKAGQFLQTFGTAEMVYCTRDGNRTYTECPRTFGFTGTPGGEPGRRITIGLLQWAPVGYGLEYAGTETIADLQVGSWLVRDAATTTAPEPATWTLLGAGVLTLGAWRRRRASRR